MTNALVLRSQHGAVRTLTLNRPASLNSFTGDMHAQFMAELNAAAADTQVRCLVLTGAGKGFCAGQDLSDPLIGPSPGHAPKDLGVVVQRFYEPLALRIKCMPIPVVAAVNGMAAGAGANLAFLCDIVMAARSASFVQAFARIGLLPDTGGTWMLPRLVGRARALGLAMLGEKLPAEKAEQIGLIWQCVDDARLMDDVQHLASRLASLPTQALTLTRSAMDTAQGTSLATALRAEADMQALLGSAHDYQEGVAAFTAKRQPKFTDRQS